jgi:REP element-mobilizing transposase RayT
MSYVRAWIHAVWGTKNRDNYLTKEIRPKVIGHIRENAKKKEIYMDRLNGHTEHLHCLFGLNADMPIAKALQLMKGECAHWINKEKITRTKFECADEYYAVCVSESDLDGVRAYIDSQEEHHRKKTFGEVVEEFMQKYNFVRQSADGSSSKGTQAGHG